MNATMRLLLTLYVLLEAAEAAITLPSLLGPYPITIIDHEVQTSRLDPLAPNPNTTRRLMTTLYAPLLTSPCSTQSSVPYISPAVGSIYAEIYAPYGLTNTTLSELQLTNCTSPTLSPDPASAPLLLFSPGFGDSRVLLRGIASAVASSGYAVLAIDHTYDAAAVEFPSGEVVEANYPPLDPDDGTLYEFLDEVRVGDASSVLDYVEAGRYPLLDGYGQGYGRKELRVGMFGHSLGGAAAVAAARNDSRVESAINYDGSIFGPVVSSGVDKPLFLMGSAKRFGSDEDNWEWTYGNSTAWKAEVIVNGTAHNGFMDWPLILPLLGLREKLDPGYYADRIGSIQGERMLEILWRYTVAFFDLAIGGKRQKILEGPDDDFPDVVYVKGSE